MAKPVADFFLTEAALFSGLSFVVKEASGSARAVEVKVKDGRLSVITTLNGGARDYVAKNMIDAKRIIDKAVSKMFSDGELLNYAIVKNVKNHLNLSVLEGGKSYSVRAVLRGEESDVSTFDQEFDATLHFAIAADKVFIDEFNKGKESLCDMPKIPSKKKARAKEPQRASA